MDRCFRSERLYPNNLKNWFFGCAKTPGIKDLEFGLNFGCEDERDKIRSNRTTSQYTQYIDEEEVRSDEVAAVLRNQNLVQTPERSQTGLYCLNTNPFAIFDPREFIAKAQKPIFQVVWV